MTTAGVGGPITGKGAHLLIIDDPIKNDEEARSPMIRQKQWDWWQSTASTRLRPGAGGRDPDPLASGRLDRPAAQGIAG